MFAATIVDPNFTSVHVVSIGSTYSPAPKRIILIPDEDNGDEAMHVVYAYLYFIVLLESPLY